MVCTNPASTAAQARAHLGTQHVGQLEYQVEVLLRTHAVAARDDDAGTLDVDLALGNLTVDDDHLHREVCVLHEFLPLDLLHLAGTRLGGAYSRRMTPSRTVAICGRLSGLTIVAMTLPPKAGRIW